MDLVFARGAFLRFVGAANESLRLIIIFWQPNNFGRVTSDPKNPLKARFRENYLESLCFNAKRVLRYIGALNESLRLIIIYYMFKYTFGAKTTLLESNQCQKSI